jgi:chromosome partitioning protein
MARIVTVATEKGGVGKTTIACGIASILASRHLATVLIDLDPQGNAGHGLGADLAGAAAADLVLRRPIVAQEIGSHLGVLVGGPALRSADVQAAHPDDLGVAVATMAQGLDAIVIDTPPGDMRLVQLGLGAAHAVVIPIEAHPFSVQGGLRIIEQVRRFAERGRTPPEIVLVMSALDTRRRDDRDLERLLEARFPDLPRLAIPQDAALAGAGRDRVPLMEAAPKARGTAALQALCDILGFGAREGAQHG